jgi:hypothetical protein
MLILGAGLLASCSLFEPRNPEEPNAEGGTWFQPDTPERVAENVQNAIAEMSEQNYIRSLSDAFTFEPALSAQAREPSLWSNWGRAEEETYFNRLRTAAEPFSGHSLELLDVSRSVISDDRFVLDAGYLLTVHHSRVDEDIPTEVQGRLIWEVVQGSDGLWQLHRWTDQDQGSNASWSDIKAVFVK